MRPFAYQLYSSRNFGPLGDTLSMLADLGYAEVEGYGALLADDAAMDALQAALDTTGLTMPTAHFGLDMVENEPAKVMSIAKRFNMRSVIIPYLTEEQRPTDAGGWHALGAKVAELGKPIVDAGLGYGWHNHDFEFVALPTGETPMELILSAGDHIGIEFDLAWARRAGQDPAQWVSSFGARILAAHIKDIAPEGQNTNEDGWADVGTGVMPWAELFAKLTALNVPSIIVEHDNPIDDRRFASASLATLRAFDTA